MRASRLAAAVIVGDLSYADCDQARWDSWGRLAEPLSSELPLLTLAGNHEIEGGCGDPAAYGRSYGPFSNGPAFQARPARHESPSQHMEHFSLTHRGSAFNETPYWNTLTTGALPAERE